MNNQEYEQKKAKCWAAYGESVKTYRHGDAAEMTLYGAFNFAYDRAYNLGKQENDAEHIDHGLEMVKDYDSRLNIAAMAMQGILTSAVTNDGDFQCSEVVARMAVMYADALIAECGK